MGSADLVLLLCLWPLLLYSASLPFGQLWSISSSTEQVYWLLGGCSMFLFPSGHSVEAIRRRRTATTYPDAAEPRGTIFLAHQRKKDYIPLVLRYITSNVQRCM